MNVPSRHLHRAVRSSTGPRASGSALRGQALTHLADVVRIGIVFGSAAFLAADDGSAALKALLVMPAALAPRLVRVHPVLDLVFVLALAAESIGRDVVGYYRGDAVSHIVLPLLSGLVLCAGLVRIGVLTPRPAARPLLGVAIVTAAAVLALGALWELVEWAVDVAFGTDYSQGYRDTIGDLLNDAIAAAGSGLLVALWLRAAVNRPALGPLIAPQAGSMPRSSGSLDDGHRAAPDKAGLR